MVGVFRIIEGIALLTLGHKLFWLFVALVGFEAGAQMASRAFPNQSEVIVILIAVAVGLLGAIMAIVLQNVLIGIAGFIAGGLIATNILDALNINAEYLPLIAFIIGGVIGAALVWTLFDWALIVLSSLMGAITLTNIFIGGDSLRVPVIVVLTVLGIAIQSGILWSQRRRRKSL